MKWTPKNLIKGRLRRSYFIIGTFLVNLPLGLFLTYYFGELRFSLYKELWILVSFCFLFMLSLIIRRLHDINISLVWSLLFILPFINIVFLFFLFFYPGNKKDNNYGKLKNRGFTKELLNIK
jgi:uncharacterized membrane protein YhaH (DUF805 family)